jgi:acyl carrier protein
MKVGGSMQVPRPTPQDDVQQKLIQIIAVSKKLPPETISRDTTFDALAIDSLDKINLSFEIEETFAIEIPDTAIGSLKTVGDMVDGVTALIAAKP